MNWFWKKKIVAPPPPIAPYRFGYTLEYFRSEPGRVEDMRKLLRSSLFQAAMSVLQHEIPLGSIDQVIGYRRAMRVIETMAEHLPKQGAEVQPTFGAEKEFPELLDEEPQPTTD